MTKYELQIKLARLLREFEYNEFPVAAKLTQEFLLGAFMQLDAPSVINPPGQNPGAGVWCNHCGAIGALAHYPGCHYVKAVPGGVPYTPGTEIVKIKSCADMYGYNIEELQAAAKKYEESAKLKYPLTTGVKTFRRETECDCYDRACHDGHAPWCATRAK